MGTTNGEAKEECVERMMQAMKDGIAAYYKRFPERWDDRAIEALDCSARGLESMLKIVDEYEIRRK